MLKADKGEVRGDSGSQTRLRNKTPGSNPASSIGGHDVDEQEPETNL
jgi:hypothetical protein